MANAGGAERMICQIASALAERGYMVHLVSWDSPVIKSYYALHPSIKWLKLGFYPTRLDKIRRTKILFKELKKCNIRLLIGFVMSADKTVYTAARLAKTKLIVAERNAPSMYWLKYSFIHRWMVFLLLHMSCRITVQFSGFIKRYPKYLHKRMMVIPNPVTTYKLKAKPHLPGINGKYTILAVTRLDKEQKRIDILIKAFAKISKKNPDWELLIIGDGPEKTALQNLANKLGISERIKIQESTADIYSVYPKANLFAIPSLWEGFPNALAEALSHGVPAIGFRDADGVAHLIGNKMGWLVDGNDSIEKFSQSLELARLKYPLITIGITSYNSEESIKRAVESALNQSWIQTEIIIVDDASTDDTLLIISEITKKYSNIRLYINEKNKGVATARNRILKESKGQFIVFFDDDDISTRTRIEEQYERIIKYENEFANGDPVICHTARKQVYPNGEVRVERTMGQAEGQRAPAGPAVSKRILLGTPLEDAYGACPTCSQMARLSTYNLIGGFDPLLRRSEDTDFNIRLAEKGGHFVGIAKPLVIQTMTKTAEKNLAEEYRNLLYMMKKNRSIMDKSGQYDYCVYWVNAKQAFYEGLHFKLLTMIFWLFLRHPILTCKRIIFHSRWRGFIV